MAFSWVALTVVQWVEWEVALLVGLRSCVRAGQTVDAKVAEKGGVKVGELVVVIDDGKVGPKVVEMAGVLDGKVVISSVVKMVGTEEIQTVDGKDAVKVERMVAKMVVSDGTVAG
jgi:hypothetical protein